jgi:hypothetical protein
VPASVKTLAAVLVDRDELKLDALKRREAEKSRLAGGIWTGENAIRLPEESISKNFTPLASGKRTKDAFVSKKRL